MDLIAGVKQTLARLGYAKIAYMGAAVVATLGLLVWVSTFSVEPKALLYSGLDPAESAKIGQKLEEMKVPFEVRGDGATILVAASQVAHARMELAASGLPHQGGAGYELLDQQSPMNMTSFMQRIQRLRALEGELARTIITLDRVKAARVHIVLPERETFARETPKSTASVAVTMAGPGRLGTAQASAIRLLVSGAVPGMTADNVSVLDSAGVVLAADDSEAAASNRISELKNARERELQRIVTDLLEPLVGHGKVRVAASVELDASREVSREEKFDPLSQIERSKQVQVDQETSTEIKPQEPVSVSQNLPNQSVGQASDPGKSATNNTRNGQTVNYELNSVRSERVQEPGELKRITVAVVVDGLADDKGQYLPRTQEQLNRLSDLIQAAVGYDVNRGDRVTVETMHFMPEADIGEGADSKTSQPLPPAAWSALAAVVIALIGGITLIILRGRGQLALTGGSTNQIGNGATAALRGAARLALAEAKPTQAPRLSAAKPRLSIPPTYQVGQPLSLEASGQETENLELSGFAADLAGGDSHQQSLLSTLFDLVDQRPEEALATLRAWIDGNP